MAPEENALRIANRPIAPAVVAAPWTIGTSSPTGGHPPRHRTNPTAMRTVNAATNPYVGMANRTPDSLEPRRFAMVTSATNPIESCTA